MVTMQNNYSPLIKYKASSPFKLFDFFFTMADLGAQLRDALPSMLIQGTALFCSIFTFFVVVIIELVFQLNYKFNLPSR
jgi:hypothetical protein